MAQGQRFDGTLADLPVALFDEDKYVAHAISEERFL